jgi:hypothetical protein
LSRVSDLVTIVAQVSLIQCSLFNELKLFMNCIYSIKMLALLLPFVSLSYEIQFKFLSFMSSGYDAMTVGE